MGVGCLGGGLLKPNPKINNAWCFDQRLVQFIFLASLNLVLCGGSFLFFYSGFVSLLGLAKIDCVCVLSTCGGK